jgi:hypothetical protein
MKSWGKDRELRLEKLGRVNKYHDNIENQIAARHFPGIQSLQVQLQKQSELWAGAVSDWHNRLVDGDGVGVRGGDQPDAPVGATDPPGGESVRSGDGTTESDVPSAGGGVTDPERGSLATLPTLAPPVKKRGRPKKVVVPGQEDRPLGESSRLPKKARTVRKGKKPGQSDADFVPLKRGGKAKSDGFAEHSITIGLLGQDVNYLELEPKIKTWVGGALRSWVLRPGERRCRKTPSFARSCYAKKQSTSENGPFLVEKSSFSVY